MYLYSKTFIHKNRAGKIIALISLLLGGVAFALGNVKFIPFPAITQRIGIILLVTAIYIAVRFLLLQYTVCVGKNNREEGATKDLYDLVIKEQRGKRYRKVCHVELNNIISVEKYNNADKADRRKEEKSTKECGYNFRYIYDSRFKAGERLVIRCQTGDYISVIYLCFDEELYRVLSENI